MTQYEQLLETAKRYSFDYVHQIEDMPPYPAAESLEKLKIFDEPLPANGTDPIAVIDLLHTIGAGGTTAQTGGRYFGFVNGGLLPVAHAAEWLTDTWNQNGALAVMSPVTSELEQICEKWIAELLHLDQGTAMGLVTGSSNALLCALAAARNYLLKKAGYDVTECGMRSAPQIRVVMGAEAHSSVMAALSILGFGKSEVELVPADHNGCIDISAVPKLDEHTLLILQAGNVTGGGYDPISELCDMAHRAGAWVHIDGAFGLWAAASKKYRYLVEGMEKADSWSVDAHKTLNAGYDCGIVLCRYRDALVFALQANGSYIQYGARRDGMMYTTEMSRRARAIPLWAVLKTLGSSGVERLIDQLCANAEYFACQLQNIGFAFVSPVSFNQFVVSCETDEKTQEVLQAIQSSGICWCSSSTWKGRLAIRVSVCSHRTTREDVDKSVEVFQRALSNAKCS